MSFATATLDPDVLVDDPAAEPTKICGECGLELSMDKFRPREAGGKRRHSTCNKCHGHGMRRLRAKRRSKLIRTFVSDVHSETSWRRVEGLVAEMLRHFKGIRGFARAWKVEIERASEVAPGAPRLLNSFVAIINLVSLVDRNRLTTPLQQAADEDLAERMKLAVLELVRDCPEVVLLAAEKLGWVVRAPEVAGER